MIHLDTLLLVISVLIILSILIARLSNNLGVPILLLFLVVGMLAGSEGPGQIYFDDTKLSQDIGILSLVFILFSGGLDTKWSKVRPVLWSALSLSTVGVLITTLSIGVFVHYAFGLSFLVSMLLGAVVASTDAAAVFSILSTRSLNLRGHVKPLLELESGSNDPMAVFLTISLIELIVKPQTSWWMLLLNFVMQMVFGLLIGFGGGKAMVWTINKVRFQVEGFYTVFTLAFAIFIYAFTATVHGSGFLAVYVAGIILRNYDIVYKKNIFRFFDGFAWLAQIGMFLTLGLLVFPSQLLLNIEAALAISLFLIFIARPAGVFISLAFTGFSWRAKTLISLTGLRGAVPIILATFPMIAGITEAGWIFNVVFFIVITSALLQGWPMPFIARMLKMDAPFRKKINSPIEFSDYEHSNMTLVNLAVSDTHHDLLNKSLVEIPLLKGSLIVTVLRNGKYFVPSGSTCLESGDQIQVLTEKNKVKTFMDYFGA